MVSSPMFARRWSKPSESQVMPSESQVMPSESQVMPSDVCAQVLVISCSCVVV